MEVSAFKPPIACCQYGLYLFSFKKDNEDNNRILADLFDASLRCQKTLPVHFPLTVPRSKKFLCCLSSNNIPTVQDNGISFSTPSISTLIVTLAKQMIKILKAEIFKSAGGEYEGNLICPITRELFIDPVVTSCGHAFERVAIEAHKKNHDWCPSCRQPGGDLSPVYLLKEEAEKIRNKFLIPTPAEVEERPIDKNPKKAELFLKIAKGMIEEKEYEEVIKQYKEVLKYTNDSSDYAPLPLFLLLLKKPLEAAYSLFCLAILQFNESKGEYLQTLNHAFSLVPRLTPLTCTALKLHLNQETEKAVNIFCALALDALKVHEKDKAIEFYERALECAPEQIDLYIRLEEFYEGNRKLQFYLSAITHFGHNPDRALAFYNAASKIAPDEPFVYLTYITTLRKGDDRLIDPYRKLAALHKKNDNQEGYLYYLSKLITWQAAEDYHTYAKALLEAKKQIEAKIVYQKWANQLQCEERWNEAFDALQEIITNIGMEIGLLEQQYLLCQNLTSKQERKTAFLLASYEEKKAESIYTTIQEKYRDIKSAKLLGEHFEKKDDKKKSLDFYCLAMENAFLQQQFQKIAAIAEKAQLIDPGFKTLSVQQRTIFSAYCAVGRMSAVLVSQENDKKENILESVLEAITQQVPTSFIGQPLLSIFFPHNKTERYLKSSQIEKIIDKENNIESMYKSRHRIARLKYKKYDLHFTQNPFHFLMRYAVDQLLFRIAGVRLSPDTMLVRFNVSNQGKKRVILF